MVLQVEEVGPLLLLLLLLLLHIRHSPHSRSHLEATYKNKSDSGFVRGRTILHNIAGRLFAGSRSRVLALGSVLSP